MPKPHFQVAVPTDAGVAKYVAEMVAELHRLAVGHTRLQVLAYLLDVARLEGERRAGEKTEKVGRCTNGQ